MESTLLTIGVILILVGLIGQVKAKEIEVGSQNPFVRIILGVIGVVFVYIALGSRNPFTPASTNTPTPTPTFSPTASETPSLNSTSTINPSPVPTLVHSPTPNVVNIDVLSNKDWQSTSIWVDADTTVDFKVVHGVWTSGDGIFPYTNGKGYEFQGQEEYICILDKKRKDCASYPLPNYQLGALIGKVGNHVFGIGDESPHLFINESGILLLRMNDEDLGLSDNKGILTVQITVHN